MALDLRVGFSLMQEAFGVPAVVMRPAPDDVPIATSVIWVTPLTEDAPSPFSLNRRERQRTLAISKADVPTLPRGTFVSAPAVLGGTETWWLVDGLPVDEDDHRRALVVPSDGPDDEDT